MRAEIEGKHLIGSHGVWFDGSGLKARIQKIEEIDQYSGSGETKQTSRHDRLLMEIKIDRSARIGCHSIRLVSAAGISNALPFRVSGEVVVREIETPHHLPAAAQPIEVPVILNGRIRQMGEVDYYSFEVLQNQQLDFECFSVDDRQRFDPRLTLYEPRGSWFDSDRPIRLATQDEESSKLVYRFGNRGRYLLAIENFLGILGSNPSYQLLVRGSQSTTTSCIPADCVGDGVEETMSERAFTRTLDLNRLALLVSRSVPKRKLDTSVKESSSGKTQEQSVAKQFHMSDDTASFRDGPFPVKEIEPNEAVTQAAAFTIPSLIEGTVSRPGDVDTYQFEVKSGLRLAVEVETPDSRPPFFNPRVAVLDAEGRELFTNIYRRVGGDGDDWQKSVQAKTVYTFEVGGTYTLQIRDITSQYGKPTFNYKVLVRDQIPHVGKVELKQDHINLVLGEAGKLAVLTEQEEGFDGEIALTVENLPPGVRALPGTEVEAERPPPLPQVNKERFLPKSQQATILLVASPNAPVTQMPHLIRLNAQPIVQGRIGAPIFVREIPMMLVRPSAVVDSSYEVAPQQKK